MANEKLIKALRCKTTNVNDCTLCAYHNACYDGTLESIAADELEADEKFIAEFIKNIELLKKQVARLRAQLPKEGEWIVEEEIDDSSGFKWCKWHCSVCHEVVQKGWQHTKDGEKPKWKYCPNCGASMMFNIKQEINSYINKKST